MKNYFHGSGKPTILRIQSEGYPTNQTDRAETSDRTYPTDQADRAETSDRTLLSAGSVFRYVELQSVQGGEIANESICYRCCYKGTA